MTNSNPYLAPHLDGDEESLPDSIPAGEIPKKLPAPNKIKLLYYVNRFINVHRLYIPLSVAPNILAVAHSKGHLGFSCCYKIITYSWFIYGFTKLLCAFICYCSQYLALQTRWHTPYGSLQSIESPPIPFFTQTLDFVFALPLSKEKYNAIMSVICKFSKQINLIQSADTWSVEQ